MLVGACRPQGRVEFFTGLGAQFAGERPRGGGECLEEETSREQRFQGCAPLLCLEQRVALHPVRICLEGRRGERCEEGRGRENEEESLAEPKRK